MGRDVCPHLPGDAGRDVCLREEMGFTMIGEGAVEVSCTGMPPVWFTSAASNFARRLCKLQICRDSILELDPQFSKLLWKDLIYQQEA